MEQHRGECEVQALASALDALVAFADREEDFMLAAALDFARAQFTERFSHR